MSKTTAMLAAAALGAFFFISDANAAVLDVQFSGNFTLGYGYYLPGFYAAQQSGAAVIGSSGDKWNYFTSASASNQSLNTVTGAASVAYCVVPGSSIFSDGPTVGS